jgi:hypothetical protein
MSSKRRGSESLTARLARDHPEIFERLKAGEFKSAKAAALAAGIIKEMITIPDDPELAARRLLMHFQGERLEAFVALMNQLAPKRTAGGKLGRGVPR